MMRCMFRKVFKQYQIFNSVVILNSVNVMNYLGRSEVSSETFLHHKAMLGHIPMIKKCKRMFRFPNPNIPICIFYSTTIPSYSLFSFFRIKFLGKFFGNAQVFSMSFRKLFAKPSGFYESISKHLFSGLAHILYMRGREFSSEPKGIFLMSLAHLFSCCKRKFFTEPIFIFNHIQSIT